MPIDSRAGHRRSEAAPRPFRSRRGLHPLLRGQKGPNTLRPLPDVRAWRSDPASWKAPANTSSGTGSKERGATGRKRAPTPCSPQLEVLSRRSRKIKKSGPHPQNPLAFCMPIGEVFGCLLAHTSIDKIPGIISRQRVTATVAHDDARLRKGLIDPRIRFDRARKRSIAKSNGRRCAHGPEFNSDLPWSPSLQP